MNTYPIAGEEILVKAFEIENVYIGLKQISNLLRSVSDVSDIHVRKSFGGPSDIHVKFKYLGTDCIVWEPYGDNSRYWIGPKDDKNSVLDMKSLETVFKAYSPPIYRKLIGDVLSLKFLKSST